MTDVLDDFESTTFEFDGKTREVLRSGSGPAVIVIAEMPGITPGRADFARRVVDVGFTAVLPSLFGTPGRAMSRGLRVESIGAGLRVAVSSPTSRRKKTSPVTSWLRALAARSTTGAAGPGVGVVGMCFTGGFALGMMVDDAVIAPVLSQPSLPFAVGKAPRRGRRGQRRRPRPGEGSDARPTRASASSACASRATSSRPTRAVRHARARARRLVRRASRSTRRRATRTASPHGALGAHRAPRRRARPTHPRCAPAGARPLPPKAAGLTRSRAIRRPEAGGQEARSRCSSASSSALTARYSPLFSSHT